MLCFDSGTRMDTMLQKDLDQNSISFHRYGFRYYGKTRISMKSVARTMLIQNGCKKYENQDRGRKVNWVLCLSYRKFQIIFNFCLFFQVLPRVMFERFSETDYSHVLMYDTARDQIAELLVEVCINLMASFSRFGFNWPAGSKIST